MYEIVNENIENLNVDLLSQKGFLENGKLNEKYFIVFKNYKILLENYLLKKLSLDEYDNKLSNSALSFFPVVFDNMDSFQKSSSLGLKYIYLRNFLSVEKLSLGDINFLLNISSDNLTSISFQIDAFIERTYKSIIDNNIDVNVKQMNCYGIDCDTFWIDSSELVFGVRYDEFFINRPEDKNIENYFERDDFLNNLIDEMTESSSKILGMKVNYIHYNEYTIKESSSYIK